MPSAFDLRVTPPLASVSVDGGDFHVIAEKSPGVFNVKSFGAVGDGTTDDSPAFAAAIAAMGPVSPPAGRILFVPPGTYRFASSLHITRTLILEGTHSGGADYGSAKLKFDAGVTGVIIDRASTAPGGAGQGDWSRIRNLAIVAAGKSGTAHGVQLYGRAWIENCYIDGFSGSGIYINTDGAGLNANCFRITQCSISTCSSHGFYVRGSDSNAGLLDGVSCVGNGGFGFKDESLTGSLYLACHADSNGEGPYYVFNAGAGGMLLNCYSEESALGSVLKHPGVSLGGTHGAGFTATSNGLIIGHRENVSPHTVLVDDASGSGKQIQLHLGSPFELSGMTVTHTDDNFGVRLAGFDQPTKMWTFGMVNSPPAFMINSYGSDGARAGRLNLPSGLFLGGVGITAPGLRLLGATVNPLQAGLDCIFRPGDFIFNRSSADDIVGWLCKEPCGFGQHWSPNDGPYYPDAIIMPTVANGFVYRIHPSSTSNATGTTEPTWPTTLGATVTETSGTVWECFGSPTSGLYPLRIRGAGKDDTATPGNATQNTQKGRVAIAASSSSVTVTNSRVTATSIIHATLQTNDTTLKSILRVVPANGSFSIVGDAAATAACSIGWTLED